MRQRAGYYIQIEPGNCFLAGGTHQPPAAWINAISRHIAADAAPSKRVLGSKPFRDTFDSITGESLKTAPKGYPKDHPEIELLRHKSLLAVHDMTDATVFEKALLKYAVKTFKTMKPFGDFLTGAIDAYS